MILLAILAWAIGFFTGTACVIVLSHVDDIWFYGWCRWTNHKGTTWTERTRDLPMPDGSTRTLTLRDCPRCNRLQLLAEDAQAAANTVNEAMDQLRERMFSPGHVEAPENLCPCPVCERDRNPGGSIKGIMGF